jgi:hypothetical protein
MFHSDTKPKVQKFQSRYAEVANRAAEIYGRKKSKVQKFQSRSIPRDVGLLSYTV